MNNAHLYKKSGGPRSGSGRNPVTDKKKQVFAMVRQSIIDLLGEDEVKRLMTNAVIFSGELDDMVISLDANMKVVKYSYKGGDIEIAELIRVSDKLCFKHDNKTYFISDFGRVPVNH